MAPTLSSQGNPVTTTSLEPDADPAHPVPLEPEGGSAQTVPLEPDADGDDADSSFNDGDSAIESLASSTTSIRDELIARVKEHGRQYQGYMSAKYVLPMDEEETERLDFQHHVVWLTMDEKSHFAPTKRLNRVLDAGCGTGIWTIDFADAHPESEVLGVDLAPVQPHNVPPNLIFEIDDLEREWTFSRKFDFIHSQMMIGAMQSWPRYVEQCFQFLETDGYFEVQDIDLVIKCDDGSLPTNSSIVRWHNYMHDAADKAGFPLDAISHVPEMMRNAGFVDIVSTPIKWPINSWPKDRKYKELGKWVSENFCWGAESFCLALFTRALGWSVEEVQVFAAALRTDLRNKKLHAYWNFYVIHGRKP
ncbi:S-adenosyl-L-methionine-dependent methyltransferase [Cucurbitaria berberidis CBS 394.84]|uniref:S-adenosyl-L-methionine-dependent methyltransferase n=1 Tax=Cucurbitaria berberidis CBS 394.84 TaxID=1168544 RepID=A0A9P4GHX7_9PLEO|nr:S-adenosyl-L-methionine-dependent methyltransferase [Cucurbitaria berberidis CBS 394.84]KAF1845544.1 S-adenosyl-L-methionine-dependent methyltransferase [Cucurbitaria berberidis CBS 394.84]